MKRKKNRFDIIIKPIVTEKSLKNVDELNQYTFDVDKRATKNEIKKVVEEKFKVTVEKVRIIPIRGKRVVFGKKRIRGRRKDKKKAVVSLKSSDTIDLFKVK